MTERVGMPNRMTTLRRVSPASMSHSALTHVKENL